MVTFSQHIRMRATRKKKIHWNRTLFLRGGPQRRGVVQRIYTESPKKPNSAKRKVAKVRLGGSKRYMRVKVPGPGHGNLARFSVVLIRGAHPRDLPGIRSSIIRGKLGANPVLVRRKSRSKYGLRKLTVESLLFKNN